MKEAIQPTRLVTPRKLGIIAAVTGAALLLTVAVTLAGPAASNFEESYKSAPRFGAYGEVITYTIVAVNTGDPVDDVTLSDTLPEFVSAPSCAVYTRTGGTAVLPCNPELIWTRNFTAGERVTTTVAVTVEAGTMAWPLVNTAHLSGTGVSVDLGPVTTTVNPYEISMPIIARNFN
jgi:uncharacterized repeat protein (TIGR01451 family)